MPTNTSNWDALEHLTEALVEDILNTPDEDLIAEMLADGEDPAFAAAATRELFEQAVAKRKA